MTQTQRKGFTLIELLMIIAIIGILSAVLLAALNDSRDSSKDASARADLNGARSQAELYFNTNGNSYTGLCGAANNAAGVKPLGGSQGQYTLAARAIGTSTNVAIGTNGATFGSTCHANATGWAAQVMLIATYNDRNIFYCTDSTGFAGTTTTSTLTANDVLCN